ncbi:MAG: hypothetical protein WCH76_07290 [Candidatus Riflemargulisbacteria bacterium]
MDKKNELILGVNKGVKVRKSNKYFTETEKHKIIQEVISSKCTKTEIWNKYTGEKEEHGNILRWMKQLGYNFEVFRKRPYLVTTQIEMSKKKKPEKSKDAENELFENLQLKKRILELEKQLKDAEMKAIAFSTMVDIAEEEFKIPIRKKLNTKL